MTNTRNSNAGSQDASRSAVGMSADGTSVVAQSIVLRRLSRSIWNPWWLCVVLGIVLSVGCAEQEGIVTYKIPKKVPEELLPGNERLIAIMIPSGESAWFFKVKGPEKAVDSIAKTFESFVKKIKFSQQGEPVLKELPEQWRLGGKKPMRFATVDITTPGKQLDLSITKLPMFGQWDDYVKENVNRWRGQVSLDPSEDKWAGGVEFDVDEIKDAAVFVDLVGEPGKGGMSGGPMMSGGNAPFASPRSIPKGLPPSGTKKQAEASPVKSTSLKYDRPEGWRDGKLNSMRMAAFETGPEDATAEITVIRALGDVKSNVARWMGQVTGQPPEDEALEEMLRGAEKLTVSGLEGQRFIIPGDAERDQKSIDVTLIPEENGRTMFVKMTGPPKTVSENEESMRTFLQSLTF